MPKKRKKPVKRIYRKGTPPPAVPPEPVTLIVTIRLPDRKTAPVIFGSEGLSDLIFGIGSGLYDGSFDVAEK
jgi:hypothetical protein